MPEGKAFTRARARRSTWRRCKRWPAPTRSKQTRCLCVWKPKYACAPVCCIAARAPPHPLHRRQDTVLGSPPQSGWRRWRTCTASFFARRGRGMPRAGCDDGRMASCAMQRRLQTSSRGSGREGSEDCAFKARLQAVSSPTAAAAAMPIGQLRGTFCRNRKSRAGAAAVARIQTCFPPNFLHCQDIV